MLMSKLGLELTECHVINFKGSSMTVTTVRDLEDLPVVLTMRHVQDVLGICRPKAYELAHTAGFPVVKLGRNFRVPRDAFLRWLDRQAGEERHDKYESQR
jgi:excisionase family DNA binding protein